MVTISADVIRDLVLPEIARTGGATLAIPGTGNQPPYLLLADKFQPPTWVVGTVSGGVMPYGPWENLIVDKAVRIITDRQWGIVPRFTPSPYAAIGFWLEDGYLHIDGVEFYTVHEMALTAAREHNQIAIYNLQSGETEYVTAPVNA